MKVIGFQQVELQNAFDVGLADDAAENADMGTAIEPEVGGRRGGTIEHDGHAWRSLRRSMKDDDQVALGKRADANRDR